VAAVRAGQSLYVDDNHMSLYGASLVRSGNSGQIRRIVVASWIQDVGCEGPQPTSSSSDEMIVA